MDSNSGRPHLEVDVAVKRMAIRLVDLFAVGVAFWLAYFIRSNLGFSVGLDTAPGEIRFDLIHTQNIHQFLSILITSWVVIASSLHHFESHERMRILTHLDECYVVFKSLTAGFILVTAITSFYSQISFSRVALVLFFVLAILCVCLWRICLKSFLHEVRRRGYNWVKILIVGGGEAGRLVRRKISHQEEFGYRVVGFIDDDPRLERQNVDGLPVLGNRYEIRNVVQSLGVDEIIVAVPSAPREAIVEILQMCERHQVNVSVVPGFFDLATPYIAVSHLGHIPLVKRHRATGSSWDESSKRLFDIVMAGIGILITTPLMALTAIAVALETGAPILFSQIRVGRHGRQFRIYKFRTMYTDAEDRLVELKHLNDIAGGIVFKMKRDPRITRVGRVLRRYSIDELPQLLNVLLGDMSLVGPRPPLVSEVQEYSSLARRRLESTPGLTGLWQVSGRNETSFDRMVELDLHYIDNWSLWQDFKIIIKSIPVVISGRGAY